MTATNSFDSTLSQLGIRRTGVSGTPEVKTALEANSLGQDAFLKLLTEQLRNQDPFEPVKNENMVAHRIQKWLSKKLPANHEAIVRPARPFSLAIIRRNMAALSVQRSFRR